MPNRRSRWRWQFRGSRHVESMVQLFSLNIITIMTQDTINQSEWDNRANWTALTYNSPKDSRIFVPKRRGFGWTLNFGHTRGKILFGAFLALPAVIFCVLWFAGFHFGKR
jgi:uncharacterized membrane protein